MMSARYTMAALLLAGACQSESVVRMELSEEAVSFAELPGYEMSRDKGAVVFVSKDRDKKDSSIVVRRVAFERRHDRTPESVSEATGKSLRALPGAKVSDPVEVDESYVPGIQFDLSYEPKSKRGRTYERRHVVLFGEEHFYHVLHTAPKGHLSDISRDFSRVVETLQEEG